MFLASRAPFQPEAGFTSCRPADERNCICTLSVIRAQGKALKPCIHTAKQQWAGGETAKSFLSKRFMFPTIQGGGEREKRTGSATGCQHSVALSVILQVTDIVLRDKDKYSFSLYEIFNTKSTISLRFVNLMAANRPAYLIIYVGKCRAGCGGAFRKSVWSPLLTLSFLS